MRTTKEVEEKNLDEIVLYEGSLEELNSRDPSRQYVFAEDRDHFRSEFYEKWNTKEADEGARRALCFYGYDGMVKVKKVEDTLEMSWGQSSSVAIEGMPIIIKPKEEQK